MSGGTGLKVIVKLFAMLREQLGTSELEMEFDGEVTLSSLLDRLEEMNPLVGNTRSKILKAVNGRYASEKTLLEDGDIVALMPPVSGG